MKRIMLALVLMVGSQGAVGAPFYNGNLLLKRCQAVNAKGIGTAEASAQDNVDAAMCAVYVTAISDAQGITSRINCGACLSRSSQDSYRESP